VLRARIATRADVPALGTALAAAFRSDPVWRWMTGASPERWEARAGEAFAREVAVKVRYGHSYTTDDRVGAALWAPPGTWRGSVGDALRSAGPMLRLCGASGSRRGLGLLRSMEKVHPKGDHWYLAVLGTDPAHQGRGVGSALLQPVLERCDLDGTGAYLESSKPENVPFYERHGFRATDVIEPGGCPPMTLMWRDPRPRDDT
jgi:ribosomal protein S18 acetylase RimI-like enzyme